VYFSHNPFNFGIDDDSGLVAQLSIAAPEIILHNGQYYIASLLPTLDGIRIARLRFIQGKTLVDSIRKDAAK